MYRFTSLALGTAMVSLSLPLTAFAAVSAPTVEPSNGFAIGVDPAWAPRHTNAGTIEHREYHKQAAANLQAWKDENKPFLSSREYARELREVLAKRGHDHRNYHNWNDDTDAERAWRESHKDMTNPYATGGSDEAVTASPVVNAPSNYSPIIDERRFEGSRPSSRLMRETDRSVGNN